MVKYLLIAGVILLTACDNPKPKNQFIIPDKNDINEIVKAIVVQDSLAFKNIPLCVDLFKINIHNIKTNPNQILLLPPPPHTHSGFVNIKQLIHSGNNEGHFNKSDSSYLIFQNNILKNFRIANNLLPGVKLTTNAIEEHNLNSDDYYAHYFELSIPIFSADRQSACIYFHNYCPRCGSGGTIFLKKINGKWKLIDQRYTWDS